MSVKTPLILSKHLTKLVPNGLNAKIWLKLENAQPTGSFKLRGIGHMIKKEGREADLLLSSSGGNAGLACAWMGGEMKKDTRVIVPEPTSEEVVNDLKVFGAKVFRHGAEWKDAHAEALRLSKEFEDDGKKVLMVHPFDHPLVWEGHSFIMDEISEQLLSVEEYNEESELIEGNRQADIVITCCGGGGLLTGLGQSIQRQSLDTEMLVMETIGAHTYHEALKEGKPVIFDAITSASKTLGGNPVCQTSIDLSKHIPIKSSVVTDEQAQEATERFLKDHKMKVEMSCGTVLASLYEHDDILMDMIEKRRQQKPQQEVNVVMVICGGRG